jgi:hypothetical protein
VDTNVSEEDTTTVFNVKVGMFRNKFCYVRRRFTRRVSASLGKNERKEGPRRGTLDYRQYEKYDRGLFQKFNVVFRKKVEFCGEWTKFALFSFIVISSHSRKFRNCEWRNNVPFHCPIG